MINRRRKRSTKQPLATPEWLVTYGDMITLLLAFFIALFTFATIDGYEIRLILSAFPGLGDFGGGKTLEEGKLPELGNSILALPSIVRDKQFNQEAAKDQSDISVPFLDTRAVIREEERGLVISLGGDVFFEPNSATVNIEQARDTLQQVALLLRSEQFSNRIFRVEGHTDSAPPNPDGEWRSNWELSIARSLNVFRYLSDYGASEQQFQVMGLSDTVPIADNDTPLGRSLNRRVDIVILNDGHI